MKITRNEIIIYSPSFFFKFIWIFMEEHKRRNLAECVQFSFPVSEQIQEKKVQTLSKDTNMYTLGTNMYFFKVLICTFKLLICTIYR